MNYILKYENSFIGKTLFLLRIKIKILFKNLIIPYNKKICLIFIFIFLSSFFNFFIAVFYFFILEN